MVYIMSSMERFDMKISFIFGVFTLQILTFFVLSPGFMFSMFSETIDNCPDEKKPTWLGHLSHSLVIATISTLFILVAIKTDLFKDRKSGLMRTGEYGRGGYGQGYQ